MQRGDIRIHEFALSWVTDSEPFTFIEAEPGDVVLLVEYTPGEHGDDWVCLLRGQLAYCVVHDVKDYTIPVEDLGIYHGHMVQLDYDDNNHPIPSTN